MIRLILDKFQNNNNDDLDSTDKVLENSSNYDKILEKITAIQDYLNSHKSLHSDLEKVNSIDDEKKQESNDI